jgi:hypothetical protein
MASQSFRFDESNPPANPPRTALSRAKRHAWAEPVVRPWLLSCLVLFLIAGAFVSFSVTRSSKGRWLVANGIKGEIEFVEINGEAVARKLYAYEPGLEAVMNIYLPGQEKYQVKGHVPPCQKPLEVKGSKIPVYVDPNNNKNFVIQDRYSLLSDLMVGCALTPPAILLLSVSLWKRHRILNLWKTGTPAVAVVIDVVKTPIAPFSQVVRFALRDHPSTRVFPVCVPIAFHVYNPKDLAYILIHPDKPTLAILPDLYN